MIARIEAMMVFILGLCLGAVFMVAFCAIWFLCYPFHVAEALLKKALPHG